MRVPRCLTIAGSDSGGGAGVQADLKTFEALGCFGMSALTALTAQNTKEVRKTFLLDPAFVVAQIEAVAEDIGVDAAKSGMLGNVGIVRAVAQVLSRFGFPLVVDPVMVAKFGARLLEKEAEAVLRDELLPRAILVTPNAPEAEALTGIRIRSLDDQVEAAQRLSRHTSAVLLKGGHLPGEEVEDVLVAGNEVHFFRRPRVRHNHTHGTGCVLSAAICAYLAHGYEIKEAVANAENFLSRALRYALPFGEGHGPIQPLSELRNDAAKIAILEELEAQASRLGSVFRRLIPEVGSNLAVATPYALTPADVAAFDGRIVRTKEGIRVGVPKFGASSHMARFLLAVREEYLEIRAAMNIRLGEDVLAAAKKAGLGAAWFDRTGEPAEEGGSLPWGVRKALTAFGGLPDLIYDHGALGKEPMLRILGKSAAEVVDKALLILRNLEEKNADP